MTPLADGFTSEAYISLSETSPITLAQIKYGPIAPDEVVVKTAAVSICATDLKAAAGKFLDLKPPLILGHEASGTVLEAGKDVHDLAPGDKVVLSYASCKNCDECISGGNAYCHSLRELNFTGTRKDGTLAGAVLGDDGKVVQIKGHFFGQSSMGRVIVARASCAVKLPPTTTAEEMKLFASLGCGIQTGAGAIWNVARPSPGSSICIFGAGSVGLAACLAARLGSPSRLVMVDNSKAKLEMLPACVRDAVTELVDSGEIQDEGDFVARLKALTPDGLGFDFVLDCVGRGELVRMGHSALRSRGMVITVGGSTDTALQVPLSQHLARGITYRGTHQGDSVPSVAIPLMVDLWRQGKFKFEQLLAFYPFEDFDQAVKDLRGGRIVKAVLINDRDIEIPV
ncbi:chaperonin 10-like protein [Apiosordaria backusii]|uniref:Chaperonin 10-like protein n=1 Tax=Apiosordaria backusii TaxID=314023 RepID=A0AA40ASN1_9PEZI|nr:chaperonin 10-like protein [Apiosordaria backusii]